MYVATLPASLGKDFGDGAFESFMAIGDDQFDPVQPALLEHQQEVPPAAPTFAVGKLHAKHLTPSVPV